jgi:hypothetical protein
MYNGYKGVCAEYVLQNKQVVVSLPEVYEAVELHFHSAAGVNLTSFNRA